jgi:extracellular elastinolytic metalloproteinase
VAPRPRAPDLIMRSFVVPRTRATHVRLRVVANQCTGGPDYAGEQDEDPRARTDCATASAQALNVRAAERQVFER